MMRKSTDTYEHTINGLLQKRREIMQEMASNARATWFACNQMQLTAY